LHIAAALKRSKIAKLLVNAGIDITIVNRVSLHPRLCKLSCMSLASSAAGLGNVCITQFISSHLISTKFLLLFSSDEMNDVV